MYFPSPFSYQSNRYTLLWWILTQPLSTARVLRDDRLSQQFTHRLQDSSLINFICTSQKPKRAPTLKYSFTLSPNCNVTCPFSVRTITLSLYYRFLCRTATTFEKICRGLQTITRAEMKVDLNCTDVFSDFKEIRRYSGKGHMKEQNVAMGRLQKGFIIQTNWDKLNIHWQFAAASVIRKDNTSVLAPNTSFSTITPDTFHSCSLNRATAKDHSRPFIPNQAWWIFKRSNGV